ncbi:MAG: OmpA family protein [Cyclobacteriaceae bacterium]
MIKPYTPQLFCTLVADLEWITIRMRKKILLFGTMLLCTTGICQIKPAQSPFTLQDTAKTAVSVKIQDLFSFPNLPRVAYYQHPKKLQAIQKAANAQDTASWYPKLYEYVKNFGIQNFFKDNQLLWQLAKLEEAQHDTLTAISLYKLVLKHYTNGMAAKMARKNLEQYNIEQKEDYVPLEYYYELVEYRKEIDTLRPPRGVYLNMGEEINSSAGDYGPSMSASNDILLFTSKRNKLERGFKTIDNEDLMMSRNDDGFWTEAEPLVNINSPYNEGSACLSPDGTTLFFSRCLAPDGFGSCDLYVAYLLEDGSWGDPQNLGKPINSNSWDSHPSLSPSGDTLFFSSDRLGGFGLSDIYYTYKNSRNQWVTPLNIGPTINTRSSEVSPFYHPEHRVLYFSSNGHLLNFGEYDIYKSYQYQSIWGEPKNIGPLVNGEGSEFYFTIDAQSKNLYYSRSVENNMGNLDLYSFPLPMEAQPLATVNLKGTLTDSETGKPFNQGIVSIIDLDNGLEVAPKFLKEDGSFSFQLVNNNRYLIIIQGEQFFRLEEIFFLSGDQEFSFETSSISSRLKFQNMEFDNGKADLKTEMYGDLDKIVDFMLDNPSIQLHIEGHTDSDGNPDLNLKLSQDRADAIRDYLIQIGYVEASRVEAIGYGSTRPIVEEITDEDKKLNRRVEFNIVKE